MSSQLVGHSVQFPPRQFQALKLLETSRPVDHGVEPPPERGSENLTSGIQKTSFNFNVCAILDCCLMSALAPISAEHGDAIRRIKKRYTRGKQGGKNESGPIGTPWLTRDAEAPDRGRAALVLSGLNCEIDGSVHAAQV